MILQIVILAMIAAFLGLRLYSVLGRRAEEEEHVPTRLEDVKRTHAENTAADRTIVQARPQPVRTVELEGVMPAVESGIRNIAAADRNFDITGFLEGAKGAYAMVLEAFWKGDKPTLRELCDDDVYDSFASAIDARDRAGEVMDNRLVRIEEAKIDSAELDGRMARIAVRFVADIAAVTRDREGTVIAGSMDDAIETRDVWTFMRNVDAAAPDWTLDETDEG
ncbi:Tim44/TimA family putative adaptor protein [Pseudopontixanthobacter vadosimaris]|uniref:Tim44/TimA family putative adaptor protein n=1 Tax=Pseudopontixanthobacter vadosimaris TaxID=2726450 RepID=UPI0014765F03